MSHMVIYRGADGKPGYQQAEDIHDAVTFVEQMRNGDGVEHARIFRLEEVVFEYRPYYRVELSGMGQPEPAMAPGPGPGPMAVATAPGGAEMAEDQAAMASVNPMVSSVNSVTSLDEPFEVVETAIDVDDPDPDAVVSNGARRGLFGR